jgi:hypothetical protein
VGARFRGNVVSRWSMPWRSSAFQAFMSRCATRIWCPGTGEVTIHISFELPCLDQWQQKADCLYHLMLYYQRRVATTLVFPYRGGS